MANEMGRDMVCVADPPIDWKRRHRTEHELRMIETSRVTHLSNELAFERSGRIEDQEEYRKLSEAFGNVDQMRVELRKAAVDAHTLIAERHAKDAPSHLKGKEAKAKKCRLCRLTLVLAAAIDRATCLTGPISA